LATAQPYDGQDAGILLAAAAANGSVVVAC